MILSSWNELVTSALLGVERRAPDLGSDAPDLLAQLPSDDGAHALLVAAAVAAVQRRAGYEPSHTEFPMPPASPPEMQRCCSPRAQNHLAQLLQDPHRYQVLLLEWLT